MAGKYVMLIGQDTRYKYVRWEAEVAREKGCTIIGANLNGLRWVDEALCPPLIRNIGAIFVPFSPRVIAHALNDWTRRPNDDWYYQAHICQSLGYAA